MTGKKITGTVVAAAVLAATIGGCAVIKQCQNSTTEEETIIISVSEIAKREESSGSEIEDTQEEKLQQSTSDTKAVQDSPDVETAVLMDYHAVHLEKILITRTEHPDGSMDTVYDQYLISDCDLKKGTEETCRYLYDESGRCSMILNTTLKSEFGMDLVKEKNVCNLLGRLLEAEGFCGDFDQAERSTESSTEGSERYEFTDEQEAVERLLPDKEYGLVRSSSSFLLPAGCGSLKIPDTLMAFVQYEKDSDLVTRTLYLRIEPLDENGDAIGKTVCTCGHTNRTDCNTGCGEDCGNESAERE